MKQQISLKQNLKLAMTPQLQQAIRLLQLSSQTLELEIKTLLEKNPALESEAEFEPIHETLGLTSDHQALEYQEWLYNREKQLSLQEHLLWQMNVENFQEKEKLIATLIIDSINEDGYLESDLEKMQDAFNTHYPEHEKSTLSEIENVLARIQQFDPCGIGARSLMECLALQLSALSPKTPVLSVAFNLLPHLELVGKKNIKALKKILNISQKNLTLGIQLLKSLNPKPGRHFFNQKSEYIIPDLIVKKENDQFKVELNIKNLPKLRLNPEYVRIMQQKNTPQSMHLLREHFNEAKNFLKSLEIRHATLIKVAKHIVEHQKDFFAIGAQQLKPLILQNIAKQCDLHESTISRITTAKYLACDQGIFELKYFFSNLVCHHKDSMDQVYSNKAIQAWVKKLILNESKTEILSDAKIAGILLGEGIQISRRTITKYREKMKIPSSQERKLLKKLKSSLF